MVPRTLLPTITCAVCLFVISGCSRLEVREGGIDDAESLFQRWGRAPLLSAEPGSWHSYSVANAGLVEVNGWMWMFARGTYHDAEGRTWDPMGAFRQPLASFDPSGPWLPVDGNPILPMRGGEWFDSNGLGDCSPVVGPDGVVYVYYSATDEERNYSIGVAFSRDSGATWDRLDEPLIEHAGVSDVLYHDGLFYLYYTSAHWDPEQRRNMDLPRIWVVTSPDPFAFDFDTAVPAVSPGRTWDRFSIGGGRVFRLAGGWYMVYQGSDTHWDFPDRFGVAVSDDLIGWQKLEGNGRPIFERGRDGTWDQGAIWQGEVLEHNGVLYMYYEGWGSPGFARERNLEYYAGGRSQVGLATCTIDEFLGWVGRR